MSQQNPSKADAGFYALIPRILRTHYNHLSAGQKWLYVCLKDLCGESNTCSSTLQVLAEETGLSAGSLSASIRQLHQEGLIQATKKKRTQGGKEVWHISMVDIWSANRAAYPTKHSEHDPVALERELRMRQAALEAEQERAAFEALPREKRPFFWVSRPVREQQEQLKVQASLQKDQGNGLPATLTFEQWIQTLDDFQWHCAYCSTGLYEVLEHFIPHRHHGGTTVSNCLPACESCNARKRNYHPLTLLDHKDLGPAIVRLQAYLESRGQEVEG